MTITRASAPSNIALIKYWGKRDIPLNLPLTSSLSVSLTSMLSHATIQPIDAEADLWDIQGDPAKSLRVLSLFRRLTDDRRPLSIRITNDFPSGAGLASSASSMAALTRALGLFFGLGDDVEREPRLASIARQGSGSAVRSLLPGYVLWDAGTDPTGRDSLPTRLFPASHLPMALLVCVVDRKVKPISSSKAMEISRQTSPLYGPFHQRNPLDIAAACRAIEAQDLPTLGRLAEDNCLAMHKVMWESTPPVDYFQEGTHLVIDTVRRLRDEGFFCFFSIDAGPNVKVFCRPEDQALLAERLKLLPGIALLQDAVCSALPPSTSEAGG